MDSVEVFNDGYDLSVLHVTSDNNNNAEDDGRRVYRQKIKYEEG
jgi:hypothetical protein